MASSLADLGALVLRTSDPLAKSRLSHVAYCTWRLHNLHIGSAQPPSRPARPPKPLLVSPKEIPAPKNSGLPLNAYMLDNLAHVELNAIDLAWDTVVLFSPFSDFLGEGSWLTSLMSPTMRVPISLGVLRDLLTLVTNMEICLLIICFGRTVRKHLIMLLHVRQQYLYSGRLEDLMLGLDSCKDWSALVTCEPLILLLRIADEEVAHVAVGVHWFVDVCLKMDCDPGFAFKDLLKEYNLELKDPFNYSARDIAGIPRDWYDASSANKQDKKEHLSAKQSTENALTRI